MSFLNCPTCKVSNHVINRGFRETLERGRLQRYRCTRCNLSFIEKDGFFHKHKSVQIILSVISQYWKGLTSRELADEHDVTQKTVLAWLTEYTSLLYRFLCRQIQRYTPKLHVDELFLKMKKTFYYLWDSICSDTRLHSGISSNDAPRNPVRAFSTKVPVPTSWSPTAHSRTHASSANGTTEPLATSTA